MYLISQLSFSRKQILRGVYEAKVSPLERRSRKVWDSGYCCKGQGPVQATVRVPEQLDSSGGKRDFRLTFGVGKEHVGNER